MNILELKSLAQHGMALYDNKLMLFADIHKLKDVFALENSIIDALVLALVTDGQINLVTEDEELHLKRGDFFACSPNYIIKRSMASMDFEALAIALSSDYCIELADMAGLDWTFRSMMQQHEVIRLDDLQIDSFRHIFSFLHFKIQSPDTPNKGRCMNHLLLSLIYQLFDMRTPQVLPRQSYSPQENLIQRFTKLLKDSNPLTPSAGAIDGKRSAGYLSVNEYANMLCVTPKYFSSTCKRLTGMTAGQIIDEEIMTTAKLLLRDNTKSIKQIAEMLGFANQSHFGTYFNRKAGMSPQMFRNGDK
jgi:AraC-like DNA-binding protein